MRLSVWGVRGSIPVPHPTAARYGGNTPCVAVTLADGTLVVLDAGTGIRELGRTLAGGTGAVHILLTHLHLDHIHGLLFFAPFFDPNREIVVWGPPSVDGSLTDRLARYLSAPLAPIELRDLPAKVDFRACGSPAFGIGSAQVQTALVNHRGATLGYRLTEGDASLCYLPDHEPALGCALRTTGTEWISGHELAAGASLLIHDAQYTDREYSDQRVGWGHSSVSDTLLFAQRAEARSLLLFHHDPWREDDQLDALRAEARDRWSASGGDAQQVNVAAEGVELEVRPA